VNDKSGQLDDRDEEITEFNNVMADIFDACLAYPNVHWRYYVQAPVDLPGSAASFNFTEMSEMLQVGLKDAAAAEIGTHCKIAEAHRHSNTIPKVGQKILAPATPIII